jgi:hypothetical protein
MGFSIDMGMSQEWKWGESQSVTKTYTAELPVVAGPGKTVEAVSTVNKGQLEVPYTIILSSKSTGVQTTMRGVWRGVSTWDLRHTVREVEP